MYRVSFDPEGWEQFALRILHLVNHCVQGGNVNVAVDLACEQAQACHEVIYASAGGRYEALLGQYGVQHRYLPQRLVNPLLVGRSMSQLIALCRDFRPDVIHAHMMSGAIFGWAASKLSGAPLVSTVHNSFNKHSLFMRFGDHVVAVSNADRALLLKRGYRADRLHVVHNGTIGSSREARESSHPSIDLRQPCVTTVCGLEKRKGVHDIIEAFRIVAPRVPEWHLYIVGDGPERDALEAQAFQSGISDRTHFLGYVDNPKDIFTQTDICVLASYAEPFGLTLCEARHAACAVIGTSVGGIPEVLNFGRAGRLVEPGNAKELAGQLDALMRDPDALASAKASAKNNSDYFNVNRVFRDYLAVYEMALKGSTNSRDRVQTANTSKSGAKAH